MRIRLYFSLFVAFLIIAVNYYAGIFDVFWLFPWFDIPMHILGGLMVGLFVQTGIDYLIHTKKDVGIGKKPLVSNSSIIKRRILIIFTLVFAVGFIWEFTEWYLGITDGLGPISRLDTIKDMIDDIIGGALSIWFWKFLFNKTKN